MKNKTLWCIFSLFGLLVLIVSYQNASAEESIRYNRNKAAVQKIRIEASKHRDSTVLSPGIAFVHTSTTANISAEMTYLDNLLINANPNAILLITVNRNPGGRIGWRYTKTVGVKYDTAESKWAIFNQDLSPMLVGVDFNVLIVTAVPESFVHIALSANIDINTTCIDHMLTNNNPNAVVMVTQNFNPGLVAGTYNNHVIGVRYSQPDSKWCVFNQDDAVVPEGAAFNILVVNQDWQSYVHNTTSGDVFIDTTYSYHPLTQDTPNGVIFLTQNLNPLGALGTQNNHEVGVYYLFTKSNWCIQNQDTSAMPVDAAFNVLVMTSDAASFVHVNTLPFHNGTGTWLEHPLIDDNPNDTVFITHNYNPSGEVGIFNDHPNALEYDYSIRTWSIANTDGISMTDNIAFNVYIPGVDMPAFVHEAAVDNTEEMFTFIRHPGSDTITSTIMFVTPNVNPGGGISTTNPHPVGVWILPSLSYWSVFNEDREDMPVGAAFNVLIATSNPNAFIHTATISNTDLHMTCIDHPLTNGNPNGYILVTHNITPLGVGWIYNAHYIGVRYDLSESKWCIFNEDSAPIPEGAAFNVLVIGNRILLPVVLR